MLHSERKFRVEISFFKLLKDGFDRCAITNPVLANLLTEPNAQAIESNYSFRRRLILNSDQLIARDTPNQQRPESRGRTGINLPVGLVLKIEKFCGIEKIPGW